MQSYSLKRVAKGILFSICIIISCTRQSGIPDDRPLPTSHCFDFTNTLSPVIVDEINNREGRQLAMHFDVDFVVVMVQSIEGMPVERYAVELFEKWRIGKSTKGAKGVLMLIAKKEQQVKIEIGYDLEHIYTDNYVGRIEREILKELLEQSDWQKGLLSTVENFTAKLERSEEKKETIKEIVGSQTGFLSGGGGAQVTFDFGAALKKPLPKLDADVRSYFGAQPTPQIAWQRYMEYCAYMIPDKTVDLLSQATVEFFKHWSSSSGQMRAEAEIMSEIPMFAITEGNYAVVMPVYGDDPEQMLKKCPYFIIREDNGWKIDLATMARSLIMINNTGGWRLTQTYHPYMFAFKNCIIAANNIYICKGQVAYLGIDYKEWDPHYKGFQICPQYDGPAYKAGLAYPTQSGFSPDILLSINNMRITEPYQDWNELMFSYKPGNRVKIKFIRDGKAREVMATLKTPPAVKNDLLYGRKRNDPWCGFYITGSMPYERKACNDWVECVVEVVPGSPAWKSGLLAGDCVYGVWDNLIDPMKAGSLKPGTLVTLDIVRQLQEHKRITMTVGNWDENSRGL